MKSLQSPTAAHTLLCAFAVAILAGAGISFAQEATAEFEIDGFRVHALLGPAELLPDVTYLAFTGDFGMREVCPDTAAITAFARRQGKLLSRADHAFVNFELPPVPENRRRATTAPVQFDAFELLRASSIDGATLANNHSLDYGYEGLDALWQQLRSEGIQPFGTREEPVYVIRNGKSEWGVFGITMLLEIPDPQKRINTFTAETLDRIRTESERLDLAIAFVHTGGRSVYPNPHEVKLVRQLVDAGIDLVVGSGSHWIQGFLDVEGVPVVLGIGNYMLTYDETGTEMIGLDLLVGIRDGEIVQLLAAPFINDVLGGRVGPASEAEFRTAVAQIAERSDLDPAKFFGDAKTQSGLWMRLRTFQAADLRNLRFRHLQYAVRTLLANPRTRVAFWAGVIGLVVLMVLVVRRRRLGYFFRRGGSA